MQEVAGSRRRTAVAVAVVIVGMSLLLPGCAGSGDTSPGAPALGGVEIPLTVGQSKSDFRATIETAIGGQDQTLLFDTGSTGLSVFSSSVPTSVGSMTGPAFQETFAGGVLLNGMIVSTPVVVADVATSGPIMIRLVQSASCDSSAPDCAAKDGLDGFVRSLGADGIFGAGLWSDGTVFSPLAQLATGGPSSIAVTWSGSVGAVTLDPVLDPTPVASLQMPSASPTPLPNGVAAWNNLAVPVCWQVDGAQASCTATAFDTGASAMSFPIGFPGGPTTNVKEFPSGQRITGSVSAGAPPFYDVTTGRSIGTDLITVIPGQSNVDTGLQIFGDFIVVFSLADGTVLLYPPS